MIVFKPERTGMTSKEQLKIYGIISSLSSSHPQRRELNMLHTGVYVHAYTHTQFCNNGAIRKGKSKFLEPFELLFGKIKFNKRNG